ncbi:MAG: hypothetical protein F6K17_25605 [Okeania sp. SIO3C4]|nr:hypothetical protein [Okeania sp. SIO3C4]
MVVSIELLNFGNWDKKEEGRRKKEEGCKIYQINHISYFLKEEGRRKKEGCKIYQINHVSYLLKEEGRKKKEGCKIYQINHVSYLLSENIFPVLCSLFPIS